MVKYDKNMKKLLFLLCIVLSLFSPKAATFSWDPPIITDPTSPAITKYHLYGKTNNISNTNYARLGSVNHPITNLVLTLPAGISQTFYATSEDTTFLESDPSNFVDYFQPVSVPPAISMLYTINSYSPSTKTWLGLTFSWPSVAASYAVTNYVVSFEYRNTLGQLITNKYNTSVPVLNLPTLALDDYRIWTQAENALGQSPVLATSYIFLYEKNNKKLQNLIVK
jgi:hypothetical protein